MTPDYRQAFASVAERYPTDITAGNWQIRHFSVTEAEEKFAKLRLNINPGRPYRYVPAGNYVGLWHRGDPIMTVTPDEMSDHAAPWRHAYMYSQTSPVSVLVAGFGIGMLPHGLLQLPNVSHVDVIEIADDVIGLAMDAFAPELRSGRLSITHADILTWQPPKGSHWDAAWFDIWDALCVDNLKDVATLKRRYAQRAKWKGFWGETTLRYEKRRRQW